MPGDKLADGSVQTQLSLPSRTNWTRLVPRPVLIGHALHLPGTPTFKATTGVPGQPGAPRYAALAGAGDGAAGVEAIGLLAEAHALDPHVRKPYAPKPQPAGPPADR